MPTKEQLKAAAEAIKRVDWKKLDAMTDAEIVAAAEADPDNPPATDEQLAGAWRVSQYSEPEMRDP